MARWRRNGQKTEQDENQLEQFEAYGSYSYDYLHQQKALEEAADNEEYDEYDDDDYVDEEDDGQEEIAPPRRKRSLLSKLIFLLICAAITLFVLQGTVFRLDEVYVIGNQTRTPQQVTAASGLVKGLNMFSISEAEIRKNLSQDFALELLKIQKEFPSTIYLYVRERLAVASFKWLGIPYTLDSTGLVMEEMNTPEAPEGMVTITGLQIVKDDIQVGLPLELKTRRQMDIYKALMSELQLQFYTDQIAVINLSDVDNIYMQTVDGITVRLGNSQHPRAKVGALRTDVAYLRQLGKTSGILDVSIPEDAKYMPDY